MNALKLTWFILGFLAGGTYYLLVDALSRLVHR